MSFSSTRGATGLAARLPPPPLFISDNDVAAAAVEGGRLPCRLGDGDVVAAIGPAASENDGKRSEGGRRESDGGVLGLDGRACLRRLCFGDVVADVGVNISGGDEEDS